MTTIKRGWLVAASALIAMLAGAYPAAAETGPIDALLKQLEQVHDFSGVSVSPDGQWTGDMDASRSGEAARTARSTSLTAAIRPPASAVECRGDGSQSFEESEVSWSPDSSEIAFLSNAGSAQREVFVISVKGGKARKLTHLHGYATDVRWSPDGKQVAVLLYAEDGGGGGPLQAAPAQTGVIQADIHNQRIAVVNAEGGTYCSSRQQS